MRRVLLAFVLCLIPSVELACSRRTAPVRLPSANSLARDQGRDRASPGEMREAIESLRKRLQGARESAEPAEASAGAVSSSGDTSSPAASAGTSGALSVETRYPAAQDSTASQTAPRGHVLTRAGDAMRRAADGMSLWVVGLCALAAALIVALLMRRPQNSA